MSTNHIQYPRGFCPGDLVGYGLSSLVFLDACSQTVVKIPLHKSFANYLSVERRIYERFAQRGGHDGLLAYHGAFEDGIRLQYAANHDLKSFHASTKVPVAQRFLWIALIAKTLAFIHEAGVIHGDLNSTNVFLDHDLSSKVADFAGSSLDKSPLLIAGASSYQYPDAPLTVSADIFALGSLMYEILTRHEPYEGQDGDEIQLRYLNREFPDTESLGRMGRIIKKCWHGEYGGCADLLDDLRSIPSCPVRDA